MSDMNDAPETTEAELEADVEMLSELLVHEFGAVERAAAKIKAQSATARDLDDDDLLGILAKLRVARAMDDFTSIYLDLKDEEVASARALLTELGDDEFEDFDASDFEDGFDDDDDFDDDDEDEDDFGVFDDDRGDDEDEDDDK